MTLRTVEEAAPTAGNDAIDFSLRRTGRANRCLTTSRRSVYGASPLGVLPG
ncbi:hypothetical protein [Nostoc sp.]|uniref:hypothetical protein n=1 Tax=Nostoc sp. TaxID=1180 RepID=UPI002FFBB35F